MPGGKVINMAKKWTYASCKAKNKEDRYVKYIGLDKEGNKIFKFRKFSKTEFKEVDGKIYQIRKDKAGNEILTATLGFENVVWRTYKNKEGKEVTTVRMTTYSKEEIDLYNRIAESLGDFKEDEPKKEDK